MSKNKYKNFLLHYIACFFVFSELLPSICDECVNIDYYNNNEKMFSFFYFSQLFCVISVQKQNKL